MQYYSNGSRISKIALIILTNTLSFFKVLTNHPHGCCRFSPTCSEYAFQAVHTFSLPVAVLKIISRVVRCNPLFKGGFDPVLPLKKG